MSTLEFRPNLTPTQMLEEGIFGGSYFGVEKLQGDYDYQSLFQETLSNISPHLYLGNKYRPKLNKFKVRSGMPFEYWVDMNWMHADDPYGWFEWYIKYFNGRRHPDDDRQIRRWQDFAGTSGRWRNNIYKKIHETSNWDISPRIQQSLLHWGYEVNEDDFNLWCIKNGKIYKEQEWCEYAGMPNPKAYE